MCGADIQAISLGVTVRGSPPRVRSRLEVGSVEVGADGITSACAEQTSGLRSVWTSGRDHLRVCGADWAFSGFPPTTRGSPPRVRSRRGGDSGSATFKGITSACAEQTY